MGAADYTQTGKTSAPALLGNFFQQQISYPEKKMWFYFKVETEKHLEYSTVLLDGVSQVQQCRVNKKKVLPCKLLQYLTTHF